MWYVMTTYEACDMCCGMGQHVAYDMLLEVFRHINFGFRFQYMYLSVEVWCRTNNSLQGYEENLVNIMMILTLNTL